MDEKAKKEFILLFNQGFEEVVLPQLEEIRDDLKDVKKELRDVKTELKDVKEEQKKQGIRLDRIDNKLDKVSAKQLDHDKRIHKLEKKQVALV